MSVSEILGEFVTGIGGIFFKSKNAEESKQWYNKVLGMNTDQYGKTFTWRDYETGKNAGCTQWSVFSSESNYFGNPNQAFMINYRVKNFDEMLLIFEKNNIEIVKPAETFEYGKFVWINDYDGNRIELWEPIDSAFGI